MKVKVEVTQVGNGKTVNQDYCVSTGNLAIVLDGCGSGERSEVGSKRMGEALRTNTYKINEKNFEETVNNLMYQFIKEDPTEERLLAELQFTIVVCIEAINEYIVFNSGDGYIVAVERNDTVRYFKLTNNMNVADGEAPAYILYNFLPSSTSARFTKREPFQVRRYSKEKYRNIYVASDGLRFLLKDTFPREERTLFEKALVGYESIPMKKILERNQTLIGDDISICT